MIGKIIKELRTNQKLTQKELAESLNLTPKMVSFYELGQRTPPSDIIIKLSKIFNVSTDYLLGVTSSDNQSKTNNQISAEDLELLQKIKNLSPEKKKAIEILVSDDKQSMVVNK